MGRSLHWLAGICASCYAVSSCALLPLPPTEMASKTEEITESTPAETSPADGSTAETVADESSNLDAESTTAKPQPNYFSEGVTRAQSAVAIGQSAQSPDDWKLAANRWQQAVQYMQQVPTDDPNHSTAQQKVKEYGQNLAMAEKRAAGQAAAPIEAAAPDRPPGLVASIPVVDQMGGTPVVPVTLIGNRGTQQFTMLFDTGASGTLITASMADAIGVIVTGSAIVTVADGRQVEIPVGYVNTLKVGDLVVRDLWVGIGGDVALLGQDVYGEYGLSIGSSQINLYE